jgi:predicted Zn-dependent protease
MAANVLTGILGAVVGVPGVGEVASLGASAYLQGFSRDQESEADHLGIRYMAKAGYDPHYMATFLNKLRDESQQEAVLAGKSPDAVDEYNMMASHPRTIDRVEAAAHEVAASGGAAAGEVKAQPYLHAIDGLVYGDDPSEGVIRDRVFSHGELGFRFEVPEGFRLNNLPKAVTAADGAGATIRFDTGRGQGSPAQYMQQWAKGIHLADIESLTVNNLPAATGRARISTNKGAMDMRAVVVAGNGTMYRFMFLTPPDKTEALSEGLRRTTYSFRMLSPEERQAVRPLRLKVVTVKAGDSVDSLAARLPFNSYRVQRFEVLNGLHDGEQVKPGQMVKLVE